MKTYDKHPLKLTLLATALLTSRAYACEVCDDDAEPKPVTAAIVVAQNTTQSSTDEKFGSEATKKTLGNAASQPTKRLGTVTVTGNRPTSLPTQIPTTVEGISAKEITEKINAFDAEDALKYFPSLLVRKRYVGDFDHAVLATRASGTGNSARSLVFADGILLSNLLGNGASFTPRWGLVSPEEIERVDVLYGPFSAAYSGNSVGAVVDYVTRMPKSFEASAKTSYSTQHFKQYGSDANYSGYGLSASLGSRSGAWSWWLSVNRLDNAGHPIAFANKLASAGIAATNGPSVTGAVADKNPRSQDWLILGDTNQIDTIQDQAKVKIAYDFSPTIRASYVLGGWKNDAERFSNSYLRDAAGTTVYSGNVVINGRQFAIAPTDFSRSKAQLEHIIHGLSLKSSTHSVFDWELAGSAYDYSKDINRAALVAYPLATQGGAGRITDLNGTGWNTITARGVWRPGTTASSQGAHIVEFGYQRNENKLRTLVSDTSDWVSAPAGARFSGFKGDTEIQGLYLQDTWTINSAWRTTAGLRFEQWRASNGELANATSVKTFTQRSENDISPKFALAYQATPDWALKGSLGRAVRYPTVSELYQGSISANTVVNNDPNLKAEQSWTSELSVERDFGFGNMRATAFLERTKDALYSQTNVSVTPNVTNIQNVDAIRTHGIELALQATDVATKGLDITSSLTWTRSIITQNDKFPVSVGKWQPRVPNWRANLLATYRANHQWSFTGGMRYSGQQYGTLDNADPNGRTYTGFSKFLVADLRVRYQHSKHLSASLGIDNVNNEKYWAFHPYTQRMFLAEMKWNQ
jgi:iron complex outermembrane recepter protein